MIHQEEHKNELNGGYPFGRPEVLGKERQGESADVMPPCCKPWVVLEDSGDEVLPNLGRKLEVPFKDGPWMEQEKGRIGCFVTVFIITIFWVVL